MPIKKNDNILLVTLLLGNVAVNSALAIFLNDIAGGLMGGLIATVAILFFGEILPMSICVKNALYIGYLSINIVWIIFICLYVITWPISVILDWLVGDVPDLNNRMILREMLNNENNDKVFTKNEKLVINGAFELKKVTIEKLMKKLDET